MLTLMQLPKQQNKLSFQKGQENDFHSPASFLPSVSSYFCFFPIFTWCHLIHFFKSFCKIRRILIPRIHCHTFHRALGGGKQSACLLHPYLVDVLIQRDPHLLLKQGRQVGGIKIQGTCNIFPAKSSARCSSTYFRTCCPSAVPSDGRSWYTCSTPPFSH